MPKRNVSLDVTEVENSVYDMSRCVKCRSCTWVDHIYMPGVKFCTRCPSAARYLFDAYGAYGRMKIAASHNPYGAPHENRRKWPSQGAKPSSKAEVLYFVGCAASYANPEIARATATVLSASGTEFMLMPDEWCCGNTLYSVGMIDEARELARRNIEAVKETGATTLLVSCAEGYRTWEDRQRLQSLRDSLCSLQHRVLGPTFSSPCSRCPAHRPQKNGPF
jgi:Fe-S oxidoreductase